jgi:peptidyl-prolyl cis-trans isomerase D
MVYNDSRDQVSFRFVAKRYETVADSLVTVNDEDYKRYYEKNKKQWDREAQATLNFVVFEARPTPKDVAAIEARFLDLFGKFQEAEEPGIFVDANSHDRFDSTWFKKGMLPPTLDTILFNAPAKTVYGPYVDGKKYKGAMVIDAKDRPDSLRASHILLAYAGAERADQNVTRLKTDAELTADSLLKEVKANPALFETLASTISDDAFARTKGGDLDWFNPAMMAPEFTAAVLT